MFAEIQSPKCKVRVGGKTVIGANVILGPRCRVIEIGYGCFLGRDIYIDVEELFIGDYTTIHHGSVLHGIRTNIGHNCWIGHYSIIDSLGGDTRLGNNVGVGAHSQLWSHMKFGDTLAGCAWNSSGRLHLDDDVWLVGHSIVAPIHAKRRAMLLTGSMANKDMEENRTYSGTPARDITDKFGAQFIDAPLADREAVFERLKKQFQNETGIHAGQFRSVESFADAPDETQFNLMSREYRPRRTEDEFRFIKFMLYDKGKFIPKVGM